MQVSVDELMFLISETIGQDPEDVQPYVEGLLEVWELLGNVQMSKMKYRQMAAMQSRPMSTMTSRAVSVAGMHM
jgi:hypothetical protein